MRTLATLAIVAATALPLAVRAETVEDMSFDGLMKMQMVDANKDGKVSKKEFLAMMDKVWEARMKKGGMSGDSMSEAQFRQMILMYLKAGG